MTTTALSPSDLVARVISPLLAKASTTCDAWDWLVSTSRWPPGVRPGGAPALADVCGGLVDEEPGTTARRANVASHLIAVVIVAVLDDEFPAAVWSTRTTDQTGSFAIKTRERGKVMPKITPSLWFDTQAVEAAEFYTSLFKNSQILTVSHYGAAGPRPEGMVMTVNFELDGQEFIALNGGPDFTFNEALSLQVNCRSQDEVDHFWDGLCEGGEEGPCGWLKDKYGVSWQVVPTVLDELVTAPNAAKSQAAMKAMMGMGKLDIGALQAAYDQA